MNRSLYITIVLLSLLVIVHPGAADSQWRGPNRDGHYLETDLLQTWPKGGPALKWSAQGIGMGWGAPSPGPNGIFVVGSSQKTDHLSAFDPNGTLRWRLGYGPQWSKGYPEARCTPTVWGTSIYVSSGAGQVACIDAQQGRIRWSRPAVEQFKGKQGYWGVTESLLIVDDKVIFTPGGKQTSLVALNQETGQTVWQTKSLDDQSAYASPILVNYADKKIIVNVLRHYFVGVDASNGRMLWSYNYSELEKPTWHSNAPYVNCVSPLYHDGHIFITSGYDHTSAMFKLSPDGESVSLTWTQPALDTHHGGVVLVDGYIYGSDWRRKSTENWVCLDWQTGEVKYSQAWHSKGAVIYADNMLYCYTEKGGYIGLIKPDPTVFEVTSSFQITLGEKQHWAHPAIYNQTLYIRHGEVLMAYDIAAPIGTFAPQPFRSCRKKRKLKTTAPYPGDRSRLRPSL